MAYFQDAYMKILPLYFPRSSQEEVEAIKLLPEDIGSEDGEPIIPERQIRIMDKPMHASMSMQSHWNQINIIVKHVYSYTCLILFSLLSKADFLLFDRFMFFNTM